MLIHLVSAHYPSSSLQKFLKEANLTDQPVNQQFESIWDLLKTRYIGTPHFAKAINMEAYYLGFMNMGCGHQVG